MTTARPVIPIRSGAQPDALVTVVIPARNEETSIAACLDSVLAQTYPRLEVLVVDGASTDRTREIVNDYADRFPNIRLLHNPDRFTPSSLNLGLAHASGAWFVRVDAHAIVSRNYIEGAINHLGTGMWGAVGGFVDPIGTTPAGRAIARAMCSRFGIGNSAHHFAGDAKPADHVPFPAYPIQLVKQLGGWNEDLVTNQDFEFDYRAGLAGYELLYDPALRISYHCQQTTRGVFRQFRRYGRGKTEVLRLHPRSARLRHFAAPALVASLGTAVALVPFSRRPIAVIASAYAAGVGIASALDGRGLDAPALRRLPVVFAAMHIGWGIGFTEGIMALAAPRLRDAPRKPSR